MITFESVPGEQVREGLEISTQFRSRYGVTFRMEDGSPIIVAKVGSPTRAFLGPPNHSGPDQPAAGEPVGSFFITNSESIGGPPAPLIIDYDQPVAAASGQVLDIDETGSGSEAWQIKTYGASGNHLESRLLASGQTGTGDGIATSFSFSRAQADIHQIRIVYAGEKRGGVGLAFDNFSPSSVQSPGDTASGPGRLTITYCDGTTQVIELDQSSCSIKSLEVDCGER
jgi:hypothetical protein